MAWIESHQAVGEHPKTILLAERLKVSMPTAVGHLHYLWWWALDYAPDGKLKRASPVIVARACKWRGKPERFWDALVEAGFIDVTIEGPHVHDWPDYAGKLIERRAANRERQQRFRNASRNTPPDADPALGNAHVTHTSQAEAALRVGLPYLPTVPTNQSTSSSVGLSPGSSHVRAREDGADLPPEVAARLAQSPIAERLTDDRRRTTDERFF